MKMMANSGSSTRKPLQKQSNLKRNPAARASYGSATGWYDSLKMSVSVPYESLLERDLLLVLDIDPRFVSSPHPTESERVSERESHG
jgi:hypothetical protein